jgi:hypothetical protein
MRFIIDAHLPKSLVQIFTDLGQMPWDNLGFRLVFVP